MGAFIYLINTPDAWAPIVCWAYPWGPGALVVITGPQGPWAPRPMGPKALVVITGPQGPGSNNGPRGPWAPGPLGPMGPNAPVKKMKILENPIFS